MGTASYIGRIGGLAVALGVGIAVATTPAVAWADETGSVSPGETTGTAGAAGTGGPSESQDTSTTSGTTTEPTGTSTAAGTATKGTSAPASGSAHADAPGTAVSTGASVRQVPPGIAISTGGADSSPKSTNETSANRDEAAALTIDEPLPTPVADSTAKDRAAPAAATTAPVGGPRGGSNRQHPSMDDPPGRLGVGANPLTATGTVAPSRPEVLPPPRIVADVAAPQSAAPQLVTAVHPTTVLPHQAHVVAQALSAARTEPTEARGTVSPVVLAALATVGLGPLAPNGPLTPVDSPLALALMAVGTRPRPFGQQVDEDTGSPSVNPTLTSQAIDAAASADQQTLAATATAPSASTQLKAATTRTKRDTTAPTVSLTAPANGTTVSGTVSLTASASDNVGVTRVQFLDGANLIAEDTNPTDGWGVSWNTTTATNGPHTLTARAYDAAGNTTTSSTVTVTVANPDTTAPTVSLTAPANGATVSGTVTLSATASDNVGVAGVQFKLDGANLGTQDTSAPYSVSWDTTTATNGTHTLTAIARDAAGNTTTSTVTVTVANAPQIPVTVTAITVDTYPSAVAISGNDAYVYGGDVIWTIDTTTKSLTDEVALYNDPPAITSDGRQYVPNPNLYYQGNAPYDSVDVIDTATGAVIKNIALPICYDCAYANPSGPRDVVLSPDGQRVYVSEDYWVETGPNTTVVTMIDTATDSVIGYVPVAPLSDMEIASDGTIYGASAEYPFVNVYNADMSQIGTVSLTSLGYYYWSPTTALALNGDGTRGYVVVQDYGYGQHVSVIDIDPASSTDNAEIAVIIERTTALSPDGSRRYVTQSDGMTVMVYDTATNAVIGSFVTDQSAGSSPRSIAVAADGTLYVTDMDDNKVYAVTVGDPTML